MIKAEIKQTDLTALNKDLRALHPDNLLKGELAPLGKVIITEAGKYPAPVGYPRTGRLGRSWSFSVIKNDLTIKNDAGYATWVQGDNQTARHGRTGWKKVSDIAIKRLDELMKRLSKKAAKIWRN